MTWLPPWLCDILLPGFPSVFSGPSPQSLQVSILLSVQDLLCCHCRIALCFLHPFLWLPFFSLYINGLQFPAQSSLLNLRPLFVGAIVYSHLHSVQGTSTCKMLATNPLDAERHIHTVCFNSCVSFLWEWFHYLPSCPKQKSFADTSFFLTNSSSSLSPSVKYHYCSSGHHT